jgi:hypothetical protein
MSAIVPVMRKAWRIAPGYHGGRGISSPPAVTEAVLELTLKEPQLSPRELAVAFLDQRQYFVSEASVYRL